MKIHYACVDGARPKRRVSYDYGILAPKKSTGSTAATEALGIRDDPEET